MALLDFGAVIVALIAALGAWAAARSTSKASKSSSIFSAKLDAEKGAYERARLFDVETIQRQDAMLVELRGQVEYLEGEVQRLKARLRKIENYEGMSDELRRQLHEHFERFGDHF